MQLAATLLARATSAPESIALIGPAGPVSYAELARRVGALAAGLRRAGLEPGDRVAITGTNEVAFVVGALATLTTGGVCVPLDPHAAPAELDRQLGAVTPRLLLRTPGAPPLPSTVSADTVRVLDAAGGGLGGSSARSEPLAVCDPSDPAVLLFTAGTAGAPKAATLTHGNLVANVAQVLEHPGLALAPDDVCLAALPVFHVFGLVVGLWVPLAAGASVVLVERFDAGATVDLLPTAGVTVVAGVPAMYAAWLALPPERAGVDAFASVRLAVSGATELPDDVAHGMLDRYGVTVHNGYGLTEAAPIVTASTAGAGPRGSGWIGPPLSGVEVRLVDADGTDALAGDPGEIWVRGPNVFAGYWEDPDTTAAVLTPDGWLRTGDIAVADANGNLRLVDRAKDLVIVSGFNVYPAEVEEALLTYEAVAEAAVVGEPHPRTGEAVVAFVVPQPGHRVDASNLMLHCSGLLARYKRPGRVEVVDELPRSFAGKVLRRALR